MPNYLQKISGALLAIGLLMLLGCGSKGEEEANAALVAPPVTDDLIHSPLASDVNAVINGLPSDPSADASIDLTIDGSKILAFQYALVHGASSCADVLFSPIKEPSEGIKENLEADGRKTLCVIAISQDENGVEKSSPFFYSWLKDSVPPVLGSPIASGPAASVTGLPANPSAAQNLHLTISGPQILGFQYVLLHQESSCAGVSFSGIKDAAEGIDAHLGSDGPKTLCLMTISKDENGQEKASPFYYSWQKDSAAPAISFSIPDGVGPQVQTGNAFTFTFEAADTASSLHDPALSLSDGSACLNAQGTAFDASCPHFLPADQLSPGRFQSPVSKSVFQSGHSYEISVRIQDGAANEQTHTYAFVWDAAPPANVASLSASAGQQQVSLNWASTADAHHYILVRRASSAVNVSAVSMSNALPGTHLGAGNFIACHTAQSSCVDASLDPYTYYHYQVFAVDAAGNIAADGPRASAQTQALASFQGLTHVYLSAPNRHISAEWQPFSAEGSSPSTVSYSLFLAGQPGEQDFTDAAGTIVGTDSLSFVDSGVDSNLYFVAKTLGSDASLDSNQREIRLKMGLGTHHKLAANGRFHGQDPLAQAYLRSAWAVAFDPFQNVVFGGAAGTVNVICKESTQAYYCKGRTLDKIYSIVGGDGSDDGPDDALASHTALGEVFGIAFDGSGNMFLADAIHARIRVVCYAPEALGFCNGKTIGHSYHLAGTGSSAVDGVDDAVAKTTGIGLPYGVGVDAAGHVYVADNTYRKIRVICANASDGPCSGRVAGNIYNLVATGVAGDAADNIQALSANIGNVQALALDRFSNVYLSDSSARIRVYCQHIAGSQHVCAGKTAGNLYRAGGTGTAGDGAHNVAATSSAIATVNGLSVSEAGNVYLSDNSAAGNRLRVLCFNVSADVSCLGRTAGNSYRIAGTGASTDGASNSLALAVAIGSPRGLAQDSSGNFLFADPTNRRLRLICAQATAGTVCAGKLPDYHYHLAGAGASSMGWNLNAMLTPMGLPQGLAEDAHGNIYTADVTNFVVRVICYNTASPGFCFNKSVGSSYILAGVGATGNAADNSLGIASNIGTVTGLEVDADGNLFIADSTNRTVRLLCGTETGVCSSRTKGFLYRYIGTTTAADTADNAVAGASGLGIPADLAFDGSGNLWIADSQFFRVRLYCFNSTGTCTGKTQGNIYRIAGTGVTGNAADEAAIATAAVGTLTAIDVDPWNNVLIGDASNFYLRVLCFNANGGFCLSKTTPAGKIFRALGTGVTGDALNGTAANASAISAMNAVQSDSKGNLYLAESTNRRIRALCVDTSASFCKGLNAGFSYRMLGSGVAGDASSNTAGRTARIDTPSRDSLLFSAGTGSLIYSGGGTPAAHGVIRVFMGE